MFVVVKINEYGGIEDAYLRTEAEATSTANDILRDLHEESGSRVVIFKAVSESKLKRTMVEIQD